MISPVISKSFDRICISQHTEGGREQVISLRYEELNEQIALLTAYSNAKKLGVEIEQLYRLQNYIGIMIHHETAWSKLLILACLEHTYRVGSGTGASLMLPIKHRSHWVGDECRAPIEHFFKFPGAKEIVTSEGGVL